MGEPPTSPGLSAPRGGEEKGGTWRIIAILPGLCLLSPAPPSLAQPAETPTIARSLPGAEIATILGRDVIDQRNEDVGPLVDLLVDKTGRPVAGVIDVGGFLGVGTRRVAVAWHLLRVVRDDDGVHIVMDMAFSAAAAAEEYQGPDNTVIVIDRAPP